MAGSPTIVVVGSYMRDFVIGVDSFPTPGETRFGHGFFTADGGKGSNQAVQAARCGVRVAIVASIGADPNGRAARERWANEEIDDSSVAVRSDEATGVAMILVDDEGRNQIVVDAGANGRLKAGDVDRAAGLIERADLVVAQLEVPEATVRRAFEIARAAGVTTLLNVAPAPASPIGALLASTDILVANEVEATALARSTGSRRDGNALRTALGVGTLVVTLGARGARVFAGEDEICRRPPDVGTIVDTTGAGDAFIGAFAARWVQGREIARALGWGLAAGSLACTAAGTVPSFAGRREIAALAGE